MSRNQITLGIRSSEGRKRLQISATSTGTSLKSQIKSLILPNNNEDFVVKKDNNGRPGQEVKFIRTSTISSLGLKNGDVLYVTPKAGTRFVTEDADENIGNGNMSTSGSSTSLASMASVKSSNNNSLVPSFVEVSHDYLHHSLKFHESCICQFLTGYFYKARQQAGITWLAFVFDYF